VVKLSLDYNNIVVRILMQFVPILLWLVTDIFRLNRIVAEGIAQSAPTDVIIRRYNLFSMLASYCVSASVTALSQSLIGRNEIAAIWFIIAIICSLVLKPIVSADSTCDSIYRLQGWLIKHRIMITLFVFLSIVGTEFIPILFSEG